MTSAAKHTAGPCAVIAPSLPKPHIIGAWICTVGNNAGDPAVFSTALGPHGELLFGDKLADATLIAEAFTVAHETGLTPRQLAERCAEWKALAVGRAAHLENIERHMCVQTGKVGAEHAAEGQELREAGRKLIVLARTAIAKAEGGAK